MSAPFDAAELQGNILRGYRRECVRHLVLEVADRAAARAFLGDSADGKGNGNAPVLTTGAEWAGKPAACFNIGLTFEGLRALGVPEASLRTFPTEFVEGMSSRAMKLGDFGPSAPEFWPAPFDDPARIHIIASIHADDDAHLDRVGQQVADAGNGRAFRVPGFRDGRNFAGNLVHFGYRDNISQPRFAEAPGRRKDKEPIVPLGALLLGYQTTLEDLRWRVPQPDELGRNGCFNAFRVLEQDVAGFEAYLDAAADELLADPRVDEVLPPGGEARIGAGLSRHAALREIVAANLCGRWRTGVPLALSPDTPDPVPPVSLTNFDYPEDSACPAGSHTRRCNPRGSKIVQRVANNTRRLVRRGVPYGAPYDPAKPDDEERGLLGNFLCANLGAQFEAVTCDWLNLGGQDPRITGSNDPLLGANERETSWFDIPVGGGDPIRLRGFPRFVRTRGGAYTFLPSISAVRYLASPTG